MIKTAFHIQKGGTGKTSLSGNCSYCAAEHIKTVLVDADPQGNSSSWFITNSFKHELADVLRDDVPLNDAMVQIKDNLYILPTFSINGLLKEFAETKLSEQPYVFDDLCKNLEGLGFGLAVFDLSPGMSMLERRVLAAMQEIITPVLPEGFSYDGIEIFNAELQNINKRWRKNVLHRKIVVNNINRSIRSHMEYYDLIKSLDYDLYTVAQDSKIKEAQIYNQSIFEYDPKSKTIPEINNLTKSILRG